MPRESLGHIRCHILNNAVIENMFGEINEETGFFETELFVDTFDLNNSSAPRDWVNTKIGVAVYAGIEQTGIPKDKWVYYPSDFARKHFDFPEKVPMG